MAQWQAGGPEVHLVWEQGRVYDPTPTVSEFWMDATGMEENSGLNGPAPKAPEKVVGWPKAPPNPKTGTECRKRWACGRRHPRRTPSVHSPTPIPPVKSFYPSSATAPLSWGCGTSYRPSSSLARCQEGWYPMDYGCIFGIQWWGLASPFWFEHDPSPDLLRVPLRGIGRMRAQAVLPGFGTVTAELRQLAVKRRQLAATQPQPAVNLTVHKVRESEMGVKVLKGETKERKWALQNPLTTRTNGWHVTNGIASFHRDRNTLHSDDPPIA